MVCSLRICLLTRVKTAVIFSEVEADLLNDVVQKSLQPLRLILDVANFNHRGAPFYLLPWVYLEAEGTQHLLNRNEESGLQPQRQAIEKANELQVKGIIGKLPEGIVSALEQYSVAHSSTDLKTRFLNTWVALETLVGQEPGSNIADSIVRSILPHIIHRRVSKIVTYLSICLHEWGFCRTVADPTGHFSRSTKGRINPGELLLALCRDDLEEVRKALGSLINTHPLLLNHLFTVHKALIKPNELLRQLNQSAKRTEWQFRRIYRARNLLVHAGSSVRSLMYLAANLEYYFSLTLSRIFHDFHRYEGWSVEKSFERRRLLYEYFLYQLENIPQEITVADLLIQPDESLSATALWH
jgi:hypothetical protein